MLLDLINKQANGFEIVALDVVLLLEFPISSVGNPIPIIEILRHTLQNLLHRVVKLIAISAPARYDVVQPILVNRLSRIIETPEIRRQ